jgi:hypothetical protein
MERPTASRPPGNTATPPPKEQPPPPAKDSLREATETLKSGASETLQSAKQAGDDFLAEQKKRLASKLDEYTAALDAACESLQQDEQNPLAGPAKRAARRMEQAANYLRDTSRESALQDLGDLARRKPEWVFGALFVAGLATARFLKASPPRRSLPSTRVKQGPPSALSSTGDSGPPATPVTALTPTLP